MKAASSLAAIALLLAGCAGIAEPPPPTPAPVVVAPEPVAYTCRQQQQASRELAALPGTMVEWMLGDYLVLRRKLRKLLGLPEPKACPDQGA